MKILICFSYYTVYDSGERQRLLDAYHEQVLHYIYIYAYTTVGLV